VSITVERSDGGIVDAEIIRPRSWILASGLCAGRMLPLNLPELEVSGLALVTAIDDCPPIADGEGSVVTARFVTREVHVVASVDVLGADGTVETITGTNIHPVWSVDRQEWVPLAELADGETLQGLDGLAVVLGVSLSRVSQPVYNIEVHGEHVYQVGELGVVVHNECPSYELGKSLTGSMSSAASAMRQAKYQAGHVVPTGVFSRRSKEVQRAVQDAKDALKRVNIDLNDAFNGFWTSVRVTWERIPMSSCSNWANDLSRCKVEQT
jgi:hypothetical protein